MDIGHSKLGGAPDLPQGSRWPMWTAPDGSRRALQFFGQVDLGAAAEASPEPLGFPTEGYLSFFADYAGEPGGGVTGAEWTTDGATVFYSAAKAQLVRCSPRIAPLVAAELLPLPSWTWPSPGGNGHRVPDTESAALASLRQAQEADLRASIPDLWFLTGRHQLGGHAVPNESGWRVLFQVSSDLMLELEWGADGAGTLCWAARDADIAAGAWDRAAFRVLPGT